MRDGMSTAKTNKMKNSITPWNRVSYRAAPNEKNRPGHKNGSLPPTWQSYDWQDILAFLLRTTTDPFCTSLFPTPPLFRKEQIWKPNSWGFQSWTLICDTPCSAIWDTTTFLACIRHGYLILYWSSRNSPDTAARGKERPWMSTALSR